MRDKIACAQFVSTLSDDFLRRTLQLEGITSLNLAVERAKTVRIIQGENFERRRENFGRFNRDFEKSNYYQKAERNGARNGNGNDARKDNGKKNPSGGK